MAMQGLSSLVIADGDSFDGCYMQFEVLAEVGVLLVMCMKRHGVWARIPHFASRIAQPRMRSFCSG